MFDVRLRNNKNILIAEIECDAGAYQYAFYLNKDGNRIATQWYSNASTIEFDCGNEAGIYSAVGFLKATDGKVSPKNSKTLVITGSSAQEISRQKGKIDVVKRSIRLKEQFLNVDRLVSPSGEQLLISMGGLEDKKFRMRTDSSGFITTGNDRNSINSIVVIGDSFVENVFVDESKRFCSIIESMDIKNGTDYFGVVLNGGCSGSTTLNLYNRMVNGIFSSPPKRILFVLPANDAYAYRYTSTYWNSSAYYANILPADPGKAEVEFGSYSDLTDVDCSRLLLLIINACKVFEVELSFATFPHVANYDNNKFLQKKYENKDWFMSICNARRFLNNTIRKIARIHDVNFVDLEEKIEGNEENFYDELHLNERGSVRVGELIYYALGSSEGCA